MNIDRTKNGIIVGWCVALGVLGYSLGMTSISGWIFLGALAVAAPVVMSRLWTKPTQSLSESIQKALH